jgi:amino acid adenylation domain-containing protein
MKNDLLHQLFEHCAETHPGKIAISEKNRDISYASLNDQANYLARILRAIGVGQDTVVSYSGNSGIDLVSSLLGIFKAGGIYLPVDVSLPVKRIRGMFEETACEVVIISKKDWKVFTDWQLPVKFLLVVDDKHLETIDVLQYENDAWKTIETPVDKRKGNPRYDVTEEYPAYIFYTSGSTGTGKPILGWHKGLTHFIDWETNEFAIDDTIRVSQLTKITFDASLRDIFIPLTNGGTLYMPSEEIRSNIPGLLEWLENNKISLVHMVPSVFRLMSKELRSGEKKNTDCLSNLKYILMAGEPLYAKDITNWREGAGEHIELVNLYGTSETTMAKTFHRIKNIPADPGQLIHAGKPITGAFIAIVNSNNELCRIGEIGDIYIKTAYRTKGYYNGTALTNKFFVQNPLNKDEEDIVHKTGDMGRYLTDRSIEVLGRSDDQVKINGMRVQLSEVDQCMLSCKGVEEAVAILYKDNNQESELIGYYTGDADKDSLRRHMIAHLGESVTPGYIVQLKEFPLSANGKINKKELPRPDELIIRNEDYEAVLPGSETELEAMWKELLGLDKIGRKVSFFEIGGNSLKAIQLISKIYKRYHVLVKINEIFALSTIEKLAQLIQAALRPVYKEIPVLPAQPHYELSHAQKRLWAINQVEANKSSYNVPAAFEIKGDLNVPVLSQAIKELVKRHETLRTRFVQIDGEPRQQIVPFDDSEILEYVDLRSVTTNTNRIQEWTAEVSHTVFDMEKGPLFRITLLHTNEYEYIYLVTLHHIICDAWSIEILNNEMLTLYDTLLKGADNKFAPLKIHYKEFASWQNKEISDPVFQGHKEYWMQHLSGRLPRLNMPLDFARPAMKRYDGRHTSFTITPQQKEQLQAIARQYDASLFMVVLSLFNTLLYKYTGQEDIIIGSPVAGREHPDLENQVGLYINTILFRNRIEGGETWEALLQRTKANTVKALTHQSYPFDMLADQLQFEQDRSRNLLFDVGFTYFNNNIFLSSGESAFNELTVKELDHELHDVKADIWFKVIETSDSLIFNITYSTDLFKPAFAERISENIRFLVSSLNIDSIRTPVNEIVKAAEQHMQQWESNNRKSIKSNNSGKLKALQLQK